MIGCSPLVCIYVLNIYGQRRELLFIFRCEVVQNLSMEFVSSLTPSFYRNSSSRLGGNKNNLLMKKFLFFVACICLISSCSNDNEETDNGGGNLKTDKLSKTTIQNAKYIYGTAGNDAKALKSSSNNFWMVDHAGNVKAIEFITESGIVKDMDIDNVFEVNDKYIIMNGMFQMEFVDKADLNDGDDAPTSFARFILVNKETGALYNFPFELNIHPVVNSGSPQFYTDTNGSFYLSDYEMIYKAKVSVNGNIEVENYIPTNQRPQSFIVNSNGICVINPDRPDCKFKLPNGKMYSLKHFIDEDSIFNIFIGFNNNFYVAYSLNNKLQIIELVENNGELNSKEIAKTDISIYSQIEFVQNHVRENHVAINGNILLEFWEGYPGQNISEQPLINIPNISQPRLYVSANYLYIRDGYNTIKSLAQINLNTNESGTLDFLKSGYEANNISVSKNSSDISFSGLRYSDGKNIIGVVDGNGLFKVNESTKAESKITTLIRLN